MTGGGNDFYKIKSMETAYAGFIIKSGMFPVKGEQNEMIPYKI